MELLDAATNIPSAISSARRRPRVTPVQGLAFLLGLAAVASTTRFWIPPLKTLAETAARSLPSAVVVLLGVVGLTLGILAGMTARKLFLRPRRSLLLVGALYLAFFPLVGLGFGLLVHGAGPLIGIPTR